MTQKILHHRPRRVMELFGWTMIDPEMFELIFIIKKLFDSILDFLNLPFQFYAQLSTFQELSQIQKTDQLDNCQKPNEKETWTSLCETFFHFSRSGFDIISGRDLFLGKRESFVSLFSIHQLPRRRKRPDSISSHCSPSTYNFSFYCSFIRFYNLLF